MGFPVNQRKRKKRRRRPEMEIPMEVVMEEILTRLPAKSLMRFKCVSKRWSSLIGSQYFRNRFITVPSLPQPRLYICLVDLIDYRNSVTLSLAPSYTSSASSFEADHDLTVPRMGGYILQNLSGFMCYTFRKMARIFNPATRQLVTLPAPIISPPPAGEGNKTLVSYYFGHDPVDDQYKVLCSTGVYLKHLQEIRSEHQVFVLGGGGSWKMVTPDFFPHIPTTRGLSIDGVMYYLAWIDIDKYAVVSFDVRSQEFMKIIQVPELLGSVKNLSLIEYGGKVTIFNQTNLRNKGEMDLWTVRNNDEWSKKTLVLQPCQLHLVNNITFKVNGTTTQNGKVLLIPEDLISPLHFLCYDLQSNDMRKIEINGIPDHWFHKDKEDMRFELMFMDQSENVIYLET